MAQIHKKFTDEQIKELMERYLNKEIERTYIQEILDIKKRRFFALVKNYRTNPATFSIQYTRRKKTRSIPQNTERAIMKELTIEKKLIEDSNVPLRSYNYSYIKDRLEKKYKQKVSLPTIINRAKKNDFYIKKPKRTAHDREVLTNYAGELIQHDSSHHKLSPYAKEKWYLITSLDDFSRLCTVAYKRDFLGSHSGSRGRYAQAWLAVFLLR